MRRAGLLMLLLLSACATASRWADFGREAWLRVGHTPAQRCHLERRAPGPPPPETAETGAIEVVRRTQPIGDYTPLHSLALADHTVVAFAVEGRGLALALVRGETLVSSTPIVGDAVYSARLAVHGDEVAVVYSLVDALGFASWSPTTEHVRVAPRTLVARLPSCIDQPRVTSLVSDGQLLWAAFIADGRGRHNDTCHGLSRSDAELSATLAIAQDGTASDLLVHPRRDRPATLAVEQGGIVVGHQSPDVGFVVVRRSPTAGR